MANAIYEVEINSLNDYAIDYRYVSLGSIGATILLAANSFILFWGHTFYFNIFVCLMAVMVIFRHMKNIQRLLSGSESKLSF